MAGSLHHPNKTTEPTWSLRAIPRAWQQNALTEWLRNLRGVVSVVTGAGKTIFAFLCINEFRKLHPAGRIVILVPTLTLLDQWYVSFQEDLGVPQESIACFSSQEKPEDLKVVNIIVINTGRKLVQDIASRDSTFLIVDECHHAGSPENAKALRGEFVATLGLSATPQREYDPGFEDYVVPVLGPIIFEYDYTEALKDGVVAPFDLVNVKVDLLPDEQNKYDRLTKRIAATLRRSKGVMEHDDKLKRILQQRAGISATARMRLPVAAKIVEEHRGVRTIVFHERIKSARGLFDVLQRRRHSACLYHSQMAPEVRRDNLRLFRRGVFDVLVACRALDEGMNVPEASLAIIASSTASYRQRIQRFGRVLRPSRAKRRATIYTLYATEVEKRRLVAEATELDGVASVTWSVGKRKSSETDIKHG